MGENAINIFENAIKLQKFNDIIENNNGRGGNAYFKNC